jgi:hypothetical protein
MLNDAHSTERVHSAQNAARSTQQHAADKVSLRLFRDERKLSLSNKRQQQATFVTLQRLSPVV